MDELYRSMSVRLYDVMEHVGASEEMRQFHQSTAIRQEMAHTMLHHMADRNLSVYIFGSSMEGSTSPGLHSDVDILICNDDYPVLENIADACAGFAFFMVRDAHTRPGYVKLQKLHNGVPLTFYNVKDDLVDCNRRCYRRHFISENADELNGPANTNLKNGIFPVDNVAASRCSSIPRFADEWSMKREYNWPSRHMFDNLTSSGCFVVGVGHPASDEKHLEWRLSFSLQERDMMLSFNPTQHKCYILLKMVKNDIIGRTIGKCVSSYHMKTCMFYIIQNTNSELWIPANLFLCLSLCLNVLLKWVRCGYCPNYFIKEENMFDRDVHRRVKQPLSYLLDRLIQAGPRILLCIDCDDVNQYLIQPERVPDSLAAVEDRRIMLSNLSICSMTFFRSLLLSCGMQYRDGPSTCLFLNKQLLFVQNDFILNRKPDNYCRQTVSQLETYIQSRLGSSFMSLAFDVGEPDIKRVLINMAETNFQQGRYCDMTSSRLVYASVLYTAEQYDRCVRLLEEIDAELGHHVVSSCSCYKVYYEGDPKQFPSSYDNTASCVIFLPSNRNITPPPLFPEMYRSVDTPPGSRDEEKNFWFDCAAVDGKIYLHFLKYLAYTKLDKHVHKQVAIDQMIWVLDNDPNLGHRETALNLLGWIQVHEHRIIDGIRWFINSWKIRPIHNAAKWHLGIAVYKHLHAIKTHTKEAI